MKGPGKDQSSEISDFSELLTLAEVAALCRVHVQTIRKAVRSGELESVQAPGTVGSKGRRIPRRALERISRGDA
jgi:excisionase family DNA binding protein